MLALGDKFRQHSTFGNGTEQMLSWHGHVKRPVPVRVLLINFTRISLCSSKQACFVTKGDMRDITELLKWSCHVQKMIVLTMRCILKILQAV